MPLYEPVDTPLDTLNETYERLHRRLASRATYDLDYRIYNLKQLAFLIKDNREAIAEALRRDLDKGETSVDLEELWPVQNEIDLAVRRLPQWMKDDSRIWDAILSYKAMRPKIKKQPKGVALIIGPWNYPWQCNLVPLIGAIAAGCPAIVKPSELAPSSSALLAELLPRYLDSEAYAVVLGGQQHAEKLLEKQWGHILFTGSGRVGKLVAGAAAKTLTPTTLELGGKSPVIIAPDADLDKVVKRMLSVKQMGAGQMCVCPDYVLCVEERLDEVLAKVKETLEAWYPPHPHVNSMLTVSSSAKLFSTAAYERQTSFINKAEGKGLVYHKGEMKAETRRMGITVLKMPKGGEGDDTGILEEELFGPILPVVPVKTVEEAVAYINARPHPLALYLCCKSSKIQKYVENNTISGSMTTNDFGLATINRTIPFGGIGDSGWGAYHGEDGFNTFTHRKAVLDVPLFFEMIMGPRYPPLTQMKRYIMRQMFTTSLSFSRPTSVEAERSTRQRARLLKWLSLAAVIIVAGYFGPSVGFKIGGWY